MIVMWCLFVSLVIVCLFVCYRLDENVAGVYEEGDFFEQQEPEHFVEQGKLLRWACIYIFPFDYMQYSKVELMTLKTLFTKDLKTILPPYVEI